MDDLGPVVGVALALGAQGLFGTVLPIALGATLLAMMAFAIGSKLNHPAESAR